MNAKLGNQTKIGNSSSVDMDDKGKGKHRLIWMQQIDLIMRQIPGIMIGPNMGALALSYIMWEQFSSKLILTWAALFFVSTTVVPGILLWRYRSMLETDRYPEFWNKRLVFSGFIAGFLWGIAGYIYFESDNFEYQLILFLFMFSAATLAMTATVTYKPVFYALTIPMILPITIRSAMEIDPVHGVLSFIAVMYMAMLIYFYRNIYTEMYNSLSLQFDNLDLISKLNKKNVEIEKASRSKSRFLASASHDLRQPLHAQILFLEELKNRIKDPSCREVFEHMKNSIFSMRDLLNVLLDTSKLDAGVIVPEIEDFPLCRVFDRLEPEFAQQMKDKGLTFRVFKSRSIIRSDPVLLERILRNIISNALRYTNNGSVLLGCRNKNNCLHIEVHDNGIGIAKDQQEIIFEEFEQLGNPERDREKGLGLGLSIVRRLSQLLDHAITLQSIVERGTIFRIEVPFTCSSRSVNEVEKGSSKSACEIDGINILVIDDELAIRQAMQGLFRQWNCQTLIASDANQALERLQTTNFYPQVILSDFRLSNSRSGVQAILDVQSKLQRLIPSIVVTGDNSPKLLSAVKENGFHLLQKPVDPEQLYNLLAGLKIREKL